MKSISNILNALLFVGLFAGVGSSSWAGANPLTSETSSIQAELRDLFATLPTIRVLMRPGARGFGHQSTAATIVMRLRQLGYGGQLEVVYPANQTAEMAMLFPQYDPLGGPEQEFPLLKLRMVREDVFRNNVERFNTVPLTIAGADDHHGQPLSAKDFAADALILLQPQNWRGDRRIQLGSVSRSLDALAQLPYLYQLPKMASPQEFIDTEMSNTLEFQNKKVGLVSILESIGRHELAPVYGHHVELGTIFANYLAGLQFALRAQPQLMAGGVIVPVFNEVIPFARRRIQRMIDENPSQLGAVKTISIYQDDFKSRIESLRANEILVVYIGPVARSVFDLFYKMASLAPLVKGLNSINLMGLVGRPYLPTIQSEQFHFSINAPGAMNLSTLALIMQAKEALSRESLSGETNAQELNTAAHRVGSFLLQAKDAGSDLTKTFWNHRLDTARLDIDHLVQALLVYKSMACELLLQSQEPTTK